ncbi:MAG TPA: cytochrome P450 [Solirubrobacterales bacterium]|nr:cytochrome P450 [Solirubrobacterales bacterium]
MADQSEIAAGKGDIEDALVLEREHWVDGPPLELFKRMRGECPVHWTSEVTELPQAKGFWSVTKADDVHAVSRDWQTYSSELGGVVVIDEVFPIELARAMFIGMDPPKHDRLKALFQAGFTPRRIAAHEEAIREIVVGVLDRLEGRETCDLVTDVAQPAVSRVIGSFMGIPEEDDKVWADLMNMALAANDPDYSPDVEDVEGTIQKAIEQIFARCSTLIAERRENPTDDLTSVLVHAEVDGEQIEEHEIVMGFFLLVAAGNDSTKATYSSAMRALMEHPDQRRMLVEDPSLIPGAVEESLRMFPAFAHFRRTATKDTELNGQKIKRGEKVVMWYASSNRDETRYEDPDRFDVLRNPEHQAFGAGGRHFCLGTALARLELKILLEETLARYPEMEMTGKPAFVESGFLNQLKTLPVRLKPPVAADPA